MIPLQDQNPTTLRPWVTYAVLALNVVIWLLLQGAGSPEPLQASVLAFGAIPCEVTAACQTIGLGRTALVTSMFMHGGWGHLLGNLLFLWVFGNNIEDAMGHLRFAAFYLMVGVAATVAHVVAQPGNGLPVVGASGAVSGILGAYILLYPRVPIRTWLPPIFVFTLPAWLFLGYWFVLQLATEIFRFGPTLAEESQVAVWAHLGGFVVGLATIKAFARPRAVIRHRSEQLRLFDERRRPL